MSTIEEEFEPSTEDVLDGLFANFCESMSVEGCATIKDIFYCGVLAAIVLAGDEDPIQILEDVDVIIANKNESGEIDTSYLLDGVKDDDEEVCDDSVEDFGIKTQSPDDEFGDLFEEE